MGIAAVRFVGLYAVANFVERYPLDGMPLNIGGWCSADPAF